MRWVALALSLSACASWRPHALSGVEMAIDGVMTLDSITSTAMRATCRRVAKACQSRKCPELDRCHTAENQLLEMATKTLSALRVALAAIQMGAEKDAMVKVRHALQLVDQLRQFAKGVRGGF